MHFSSKIRCAAAILGLALTITHPALAERKVALVVGNSGYTNVPRLPNPVSYTHLTLPTSDLV